MELLKKNCTYIIFQYVHSINYLVSINSWITILKKGNVGLIEKKIYMFVI